MTKRPVKDVGTSVRARLLRLAQERGEDFQLVLTRYANERLLFRLASSDHASGFVLKGAALFTVWTGGRIGRRETSTFSGSATQMWREFAIFSDILSLDVVDDGDSAGFHVIDGTAERAPVEGVLRRKGLPDELRGDTYAVVEDASGHAHYVRADAAELAQVEEGAIVRVSASRDTWAKGMDAAIVRFAAASDGLYDPARHVAALERAPLVIAGERVEGRAVVAANVRRLERLVRYRLVERLADGRWRVPADWSPSSRPGRGPIPACA